MELDYSSEMEIFGDIGILAIAGETDLYTASQFKRDLEEAMLLAKGDLVLDLTDLDLVDSTALGMMMSVSRRLAEEERTLVLVITRSHVLRLFDITGLKSLFGISATVPEAMASLAMGHGFQRVA